MSLFFRAELSNCTTFDSIKYVYRLGYFGSFLYIQGIKCTFTIQDFSQSLDKPKLKLIHFLKDL